MQDAQRGVGCVGQEEPFFYRCATERPEPCIQRRAAKYFSDRTQMVQQRDRSLFVEHQRGVPSADDDYECWPH